MATRLLISGTVQGVWFRESTKQEAQRLGATGWVQNLPDGRVEAMIDGAPEAVAALVAWCQHGPDKADVTAVETMDAPDEPAHPDFVVLRR